METAIQDRRRDELKVLVRSMADHIVTTGKETPQAAEYLIQNAIEPLCPFNETDLLQNPPTEQQLRGQWDVVSFRRAPEQQGGDQQGPRKTDLEKLTYGAIRFPQQQQRTPVSVLRTYNEVEPSAKNYHTVHLISSNNTTDTTTHAYCIIYGTYEVTASSHKRPKSNTLVVTYTHASLAPAANASDDAQFRSAFGVPPQNVPLSPTHQCTICVVYVDHDMRIEFTGENNQQGFILRLVRRQGQGISTRFAVTSVPMEDDAFVLAVG